MVDCILKSAFKLWNRTGQGFRAELKSLKIRLLLALFEHTVLVLRKIM